MSDGYRLAALKLYAIAPTDREWLLAKLEEPVKTRLKALLGDLAQTGLQPEDVARAGVEPSRGTAPARRGALASEARATRLEAAPARLAAHVIGEEPDWIGAVLIDSGSPKWRATVIGALGSVKARSLARARPAAARVQPRVREALIDAFAARVERLLREEGAEFDQVADQIDRVVTLRPAGRLERLRTMVTRWTR